MPAKCIFSGLSVGLAALIDLGPAQLGTFKATPGSKRRCLMIHLPLFAPSCSWPTCSGLASPSIRNHAIPKPVTTCRSSWGCACQAINELL
ncbi:hypothetical protein VTN77DRAFT_3763 [Rasamsonia byssochlamydoides]|uniref:uncharacterized protein n=1 Tax=Rasamsonia byssochlamydoides TaxID=89139 RepID=UPI003742049D